MIGLVQRLHNPVDGAVEVVRGEGLFDEHVDAGGFGIAEIRIILRRSVTLKASDIPTKYVGIGSYVRVKDLDLDEKWSLRIVDPVEADPSEDRISYEAPIGEALMGRKARETVEVQVPDGKIRYRITSISK